MRFLLHLVTAVGATLVPGNLVDWERGSAADSAVVASDPAKTFGVILRKGNSAAAQFDTSKFGPEVTRHNDSNRADGRCRLGLQQETGQHDHGR